MTSSSRATNAATFLLPLAAFLFAPPALAQRSAQDIASARQLYNDGITLRDKGDLKGALEKFKAAHALGDTPITGLELCKTHRALNQPVEAREACLSVGRIAPIKEESQRSKDARVEAPKIAEEERAKIGSIKVKLTGAPEGATPTVLIDGDEIPAVALSEPRPVDPGAHTIVAKVGSGPETRASVETTAGENREVEVAILPPPVETIVMTGPSPAPTAPPPPKRSYALPAALLATGGVGVTLGVVTGLVALSKKSDLDDACPHKVCGPDNYSRLDHAQTWGTVSTVGFIVGGLALGAGIVALIVSPSASASPRVGLGAEGLHGSF